MKFLLILYTSLPALTAAVIARHNFISFISASALFVFQVIIEFFLLNTRKKRVLIILTSVLAIVFTAVTVFSGSIREWSYFRLFPNLYPGPLLTIIFVLIFKMSRIQEFSRLSKGLNRIILLLFSYAAMLLLLLLHSTFRSALPAVDFLIKLYEIANYLPAIYFLWKLKNVFLPHVYFGQDEIRYRNEEISSLFNEIELSIFNLILKGRDIIRCRDIVPLMNEIYTGKKYKCNPGSTIATKCPSYKVIYRHISSLDKKLDNMGIGTIIPPENKKEITEQGWRFNPGKDVKILKRLPFPLKIPAVREVSEKRTRSIFGFFTTLFLCIGGNLALAFEAVYKTGGELTYYLVPIPTAILSVLILIPILKTQFPLRRTSVFSLTTLVLGPFSLVGFLSEGEVLLLSMKAIVLFILCLLIRFPYFEKYKNFNHIRESAPDVLFWLIWFYMVILSLFIEPDFTYSSSIMKMDYPIFLSHVFNRLLLLLLFSLSAGFFSLGQKPLVVSDHKLMFNGRQLPAGLGKINTAIVEELIDNPDKPLHCYRILEIIDKEATSECGGYCKPSVCLSYQKIYKRIRTISKYLQTSGIGTVSSPERKAESHKEGWTLLLFDDVYIKQL